jgi:tagatose 1,6-diphosphate aldolase
MITKMTPGKVAGLQAVADERGVIAAAAMDQRGLLKNMLIRELGGKEPSDQMMSEFKQIVARTLTKHASSILLDVQYGLEATKNINGKGLLLAYEKAGYSPDRPERLPSLSEGWSALRIKEAGADAVKILVYYSPFEQEWVNDQKKAWVERIGAECRAIDIPYFLEFLGYSVHGEDESGPEYAKRKPELVIRSMEEFTKERYGADVLKVDVPIQMAYVEGTNAFKGHALHTRAEAMSLLREAADKTDLPIVYLSAGVTSPVFIETLELASEAGCEFHGVLAGRATWQNGVPVYVKEGPVAFESWMNTQGAENIENINRTLRLARPWYEARSLRAASETVSR